MFSTKFFLVNLGLVLIKSFYMKKQLLTAFAALTSFIAVSQNSIPNGNFENWNTYVYDFPQGYEQNSNVQTFFRCNAPFNVTRTTDAYNATYALRLETTSSVSDTCGAYLLNATEANGNPSSWQGGIPYNQQATGIRGYYKYNVASGDSGLMIAVFKKNGSSIGTYFFLVGGLQTNYTLFQFPLVPALPMAPDTIIFAAASSNLVSEEGVPGSVLLLDSISFTGVASQPADLNGDFELWSNNSIYDPIGWEISNSEGRGVSRSTDAAGGTYAVELTTYEGDNNGVPRASSGYIGNGYYDWQGCNCYVGGFPYTNQIDTLVFSYKYAPVISTDSAYLSINFKDNGNPFMMTGVYMTASATYQTVEVPFNLSTQPDTAFIWMQSNQWDDTTLNHVGASLLIDEIYFKSQPIGLKENLLLNQSVSFFPNPMKSTASIIINKDININNTRLLIYDALGNEIRNTAVSSHKVTFEKNELPAGVYIYKLLGESATIKTGKIVVE